MQQVGMHLPTKMLVMRPACYVDGSFLGPASPLEGLQHVVGPYHVFLRWKSEIDSAKDPERQYLLVPVL